jgi:hypothetical protein
LTEKPQEPQQAATEDNSQQIADNFVACDRCSFFWAGYRILHGETGIEEAIRTSDGSWLEMVWDPPTRHLLQKSYGGRLDVELFYYDSQCPACQRRLVYGSGEEENDPPSFFRIQIKPREP